MENTIDFTPLLSAKELMQKRSKRRLQWVIYWITAVLFVALSSIANAQDYKLDIDNLHLDEPCAPAVPEPRRAKLAHDGVVGYWFQYDVSRCMLTRLKVLPPLISRVGLLEERLEASNDVIRLQKESVSLANKSRESAENSLGAAIKGKRLAEERLDHWTRSPYLWLGIGVIVTIGIMAGSAAVLKAVKD